MKHGITYSAPARRTYHGKRARRSAFYHWQRTVRTLAGVARAFREKWLNELTDTAALAIYGQVWYRVRSEVSSNLVVMEHIPIEGVWLP